MSNKIVDPRAAERRRSLIMMLVAAVVVIAVAVAVIFIATKDGSKSEAGGDVSAPEGTAVPTVLTDDSFRMTTAPAGTTPPAVLTVIEDFQCPGCRAFEAAYGETLTKLAQNPNVAVDYKPIAFLDQMSEDFYSSRAANASLCVGEATGKEGDLSTWFKFHNLLYQNQPAEGGAGLSPSEINDLAGQAGAGDQSKCIEGGDYGKWIGEHTQRVMDGDFQGTPTVVLNGQRIDMQAEQMDPAKLEQRVLDAAGQ